MTETIGLRRGNRGLVVGAIVLLAIVIGVVAYFLIPSGPGELVAGLDTISWTKDVPDTVVSKDGNVVSVTTTSGKTEYQIEATPRLPAGKILIDYKIDLIDGGILIGVLSADRRRWVAMSPIGTRGENSKSIALTLSESGIVVLANNRETDGQSHFKVERLNFYKQ